MKTITEKIEYIRQHKPTDWVKNETSEINTWESVVLDIKGSINSCMFNHPLYGGDPNIDLETAQHNFLDYIIDRLTDINAKPAPPKDM